MTMPNLASWLLARSIRVPEVIETLAEAFHRLEPRQLKARLQTILKAATVYKDGRIELDFRG
jgi:hypothetical protein